MKFVRKYKIALIIAVICIIFMILGGFTIYRMFYPNSGIDKYGSRMDGSYPIDLVVIEKIKTEMEETTLVESVSYRESGPVIKFFISCLDATATVDATALTNIILNNLSEDVLSFYDIDVYFTGEDNADFPMIAYKSKMGTDFKYTTNKEIEEVVE